MANQPARIGYSIKEAAEVSTLGRTTIYSHLKSGRLASKRCGGRRIVSAESLHALVKGEDA